MSKFVLIILSIFVFTLNVFSQTSTTHELKQNLTAFDATLTGNSADIYLDGSYLTLQSDNTDRVDITYTLGTAGTYTVRYYIQTFDNGSARNNDLYVNDVKVADVAYSSTSWGTVDQSITLSSGLNTISLRRDWGYTKIRYIELLSGTTVLKGFHLDDDDLSYSGSSILLTHASGSSPEGRIFINYRQGSGTGSNPNISTGYVVNAPESGSYRLSFDVNLGYSSAAEDRTQSLYIDSIFVQNLEFNVTDIGKTFNDSTWFTFNFDDISLTAGTHTIEIRQSWGFMFFADVRVYLKEEKVTISGNEGWRLLSLPKSGGIIDDISDDVPIQGINGGDDPTASDANVILYQSGNSFGEPANVTTAWGDGFGFGLYLFNNTTNNSSNLPITLDISGAEPSSNVAVDLNTTPSGGTDGAGAADSKYTLVGNPFASNYDLSAFTVSSGVGIQDNVHFWNDGTGSYSTIDRTTSSGYIVSPWQGFWVEVLTSQTASQITFPTSGKTSSDADGTFFSKKVNNHGDISFTLTSDDSFDEAIRLAFRPYANSGMDPADASKLTPMAPNFATMSFASNNRLKSVESLPYYLEEEVSLSLHPQFVGIDGEFTFNWSGIETIPAEWEIILHDHEMETSLNMREVSEYVFMAEADAQMKKNPLSILSGSVAISMKAKDEASRFGITIRPNSVNNEVSEDPTVFALYQNYPNPFNPSTTIGYSIKKAGMVNISVYNLMGQKVATLMNENKSAGQYNVSWNAANVTSGMYYYRLIANGQAITRKMTLIK